MKKYFFIFLLLIISGCASNLTKREAPVSSAQVTIVPIQETAESENLREINNGGLGSDVQQPVIINVENIENSNLENVKKIVDDPVVDSALISNSEETVDKPVNTDGASNCKVYTYQDKYYYGVGKKCLDKIVIKGIYFVSKNQTAGVKSYWRESMLDIFGQIKNFYGGQFNNKIQIVIDEPVMINGERNIEGYTQDEINREIRNKIEISSPGSFVVLMFYPIQGVDDKRINGSVFGGGGGEGNSSSAMNGWFWLDPESLGTVTTKYGTDYSGYLGSAHEFGHALGIPHPWEEERNKDSVGKVIDINYGNEEKGSLMSYSGQSGPLVPNSFIRVQVKEKMIVDF